jgi:hypothetical protein
MLQLAGAFLTTDRAERLRRHIASCEEGCAHASEFGNRPHSEFLKFTEQGGQALAPLACEREKGHVFLIESGESWWGMMVCMFRTTGWRCFTVWRALTLIRPFTTR